jgi:uncharacterized protein (DUF983 family)
MEPFKVKSKPNIIFSTLTNKCPYCRTKGMFVNPNPYNLKETLKMDRYCKACGGDFEPEQGFYYGTGYVSYGLSVGMSIISFILYYLIFGISIYDNSLFIWLGIAITSLIVFQPYIMRLSRTIWLTFFTKKFKDKKDPNFKPQP